MAILDIIAYPDPLLKKASALVSSIDDGIRNFVLELEETMRAGPGSVGIAAPQVGRLDRIMIVDVSSKPNLKSSEKSNGRMVLINPEIIEWEGYATGREGCMSVPDYTGNVIRAEKIKLEARDEFFKLVHYECVGYEARAVQHEIDHLDGLLFLDRLVSRRNDLFRRKAYKK